MPAVRQLDSSCDHATFYVVEDSPRALVSYTYASRRLACITCARANCEHTAMVAAHRRATQRAMSA